MSQRRPEKNRKAVHRLHTREASIVEYKQIDQVVLDVVLKKLFDNTVKNMLHLENEIYAPSNIKLHPEDAERIWEIMISTGWVTPVIGFGNSGKVELTRAGYQFMAQYGGYSQYLAAVNQPAQPQTIILPIQIQGEDPAPEQSQITCERKKPMPRKTKKKTKK
jgi:hypothetical protein